MRNELDRQLRKNDCGISAVKTVCNVLGVDIDRQLITEEIKLDEEGASLSSINDFFNQHGFKTDFKLLDLNSVNGNQAELNHLFPAIIPIKKGQGLHYVVIKSLKNYNFEVLDPDETKPTKISLDQLKNIAVKTTAKVDYVSVEEVIKVQVESLFHEYNLEFNGNLTDLKMSEFFNKSMYFSYIEEKFGFKNKDVAKEFLKDLLYNQELKHIPERFRDFSVKKQMAKIKAPVLLTVKKTEETIDIPGDKNISVYWRLFKMVKSIRTLWYIFIATSIIASAIGYVSVFINQLLIDYVLPSYDLNILKIFAIGVGTFYLVNKFFSIYKKFVSIHLSNAFDRYFLSMFDKKLSNFSIRYIQSYKKGDLTERLRDTMKLKSFFTRYFTSIVVNLIIASTSFFVLVAMNWQLSLIVLLVMFLFGVIFKVFTPIIENLERQRYIKKASFMSKFLEKIEGIQSIKALGLEAYSSAQINNGIDELINIQTRSKYVSIINSVLTSIITTFASLALLVLTSVQLIKYNSMSLGMILTFLALSSKIFKAFSSLLDKNLSIQENKVILDRFFSFEENFSKEEDKEESKNKARHKSSILSKDLNLIQKENYNLENLELSNVSFSYNHEKKILQDINFKISKGEKIHIQGKNGSGKSTLCKILGNLYEPSTGEMQFNEIDISLFDKKELRKEVLFISGEDILFNESFIFNVSLGRPIDFKKLIEYTKALGLYDFIQKKTDKYDFMIYENGRNLSTGQRKKVLLLRALLSKANLIILDEIFNGLDIESKTGTEQLLSKLTDKAFILISHMPINNIDFNHKYQLKDGILSDQAA